MKRIEIRTEYIQLAAAMKLAGLVGAGGEAKHLVADGEVKVNGEVEVRRGRKLRVGDLFEFRGEQVMVDGVGQTR